MSALCQHNTYQLTVDLDSWNHCRLRISSP